MLTPSISMANQHGCTREYVRREIIYECLSIHKNERRYLKTAGEHYAHLKKASPQQQHERRSGMATLFYSLSSLMCVKNVWNYYLQTRNCNYAFLCHPFGYENVRSIVSGKRNFRHSEFSAMKVSTHEITIYFIFRILLVSLNFRKHLMPEQKDVSCLKQFMKMKSFIFRGRADEMQQ